MISSEIPLKMLSAKWWPYFQVSLSQNTRFAFWKSKPPWFILHGHSHIHGLMQNKCNSILNTLESHLFWTSHWYGLKSITLYHQLSFWATNWINPLLSWWHHDLETLPTLLALCHGNPPEGSPTKGPVMQCFEVALISVWTLLLHKQSNYQWFEALWHSCDVTVIYILRLSPWHWNWH